MCSAMLRAGLALAAFAVPVFSLAQSPVAAEEERTKAINQAETIMTPAPVAEPKVTLNIIDQKLALSLAVDTWGQIAANERALKSASSDTMRTLIAQRLETQQTFASLLNSLTDGRTMTAIEDARREIAADNASTNTGASTKAKVVRFRPLTLHKNATAMMVRIRMEILEGYLAEVESGLAAKTGDEFDRHFLRGDVMHQMQLLAMLEVFERQASPDFAGVIQQEIGVARDHLAQSRQMLVQLETPALAGSALVAPTAAIPLEQR